MISEMGSDFVKLNQTLLRIASKYVGNKDDAEDLVQETLKTIIEKQPAAAGCEDQKGFVLWCYRILRNKIGNYYRMRMRRGSKQRVLNHVFGFMRANSADPSELYNAQELHDKLIRALRQLDTHHRKVIWLLYSGCDKEQMLKELGLSNPKQLKNKIFRSREKLRKLWLTIGPKEI